MRHGTEVAVRRPDGSLVVGVVVGFYRRADGDEALVKLASGESIRVGVDTITYLDERIA